jgi:hypothetical protein
LGIDIYVGTLSRYYRRDWELVAQRVARESGLPFEVAYQFNLPFQDRSPTEVQQITEAWRDAITAQLRDRLGVTNTWDESDTNPYFTDKPDWDGFAAASLWAAYEEHPGLTRPEGAVSQDWLADPAVQASLAPDFSSRYGALLYGATMWLPGEFEEAFGLTDPAGGRRGVASSVRLLRELIDLGERTWQPDPEILEVWRRGEGAGDEGIDLPDPEDPASVTRFHEEAERQRGERSLEMQARWGYAILRWAAERSVAERLPMVLDS